MTALRAMLLILASLGALYYVLSTLALLSYYRHRRKEKKAPIRSPTVSVLKPVRGLDADAQSNFRSFLGQDYPSYEVIFGVLDPTDPAVPTIEELIKCAPNASLHVGSGLIGSNNKVRILYKLLQQATGDIIVITDSDTRVEPDALTKISAAFDDPSVGVVTCMYRGTRAKTVADALEGLLMTSVFQPGVACAYALGLDFGLGAMIAIHRPVLEEIGGFESIVDYLADDFQLASKAARAGYRIKLPDYIVDIVLSGDTLRNVLSRELRWAQTVKVSNPTGYLGMVVSHGLPYALFYAAATGFSTLGWTVLLGAAAIRLVTAYIGARICLSDREFPSRAHLLPLRDLLTFAIWAAAYFTSTVKWRGRKLRLTKDGRIAETG